MRKEDGRAQRLGAWTLRQPAWAEISALPLFIYMSLDK